jgi:hypothetical protein
LLIQRKARSRVIVNLQQLQDVLAIFPGLHVRLVRLEGASLADQMRLFSAASIIVAAHGNALGNIVWMAPHSAVMELLGGGFETGFFAMVGNQQAFTWRQVWCKAAALGGSLVGKQAVALLKDLASHPHLGSMLALDASSQLASIQRRIEEGRYRADGGIALANGVALPFNVHTGNVQAAACRVSSVYLGRGDSDPKHNHVYMPPLQFLQEFAALLKGWAEARTPF